VLQLRLDDLGTPLIDTTFVVLDLETTGLDPAADRITEVGAVRVRGGEVLGELRTFVHPGRPIPAAITAVTGITDAMVRDAPPVAAVLGHVLGFLDGAVFVAHNASFDLAFLRRAAARTGHPEPDPVVLDTARLSRRLLRDEVRDHRLATLARHLRARTTPEHRALADARATVDVLHGLLERAGSLGATTVEDVLELTRSRSERAFRRRGLVADAPAACGVYRFHDAAGRTLYVGKATDLRARLRTYFGQDPRRRIADLVRETSEVTWRTTPTLLEAEVVELRAIQAEQPRYNRRSRNPAPARWLALTREPFPRLSVVRAPSAGHLTAIGPLPGPRAAHALREAIEEVLPVRTCTTRLRLRQDHPACLLKDLGRCGAPCDGSQDATSYRQVTEAIASLVDDPSPLLTGLAMRMREQAERGRYERATALRDLRARTARLLQGVRDSAWLTGVDDLVLRRGTGSATETVRLCRGRLVATTRSAEDADPTPVPGAEASPAAAATVAPPASLAELDLVLRWLAQGPVRIVAASSPVAGPVHGGRELATVLREARATDRQVRRDLQELSGRKVRRRSGDGGAVRDGGIGGQQVDGAVGVQTTEHQELAAEAGDAAGTEVERRDDLPADELLGRVVGDLRTGTSHADDRSEVDGQLQRGGTGLGEGGRVEHGADPQVEREEAVETDLRLGRQAAGLVGAGLGIDAVGLSHPGSPPPGRSRRSSGP
jgi:DNA polymerase III subunit epsilon